VSTSTAGTAGGPSPVLNVVKRLAAGESPEPRELTEAFEVILRGDATPVQIASLLVGMRVKGETGDELAAVVRAFRHTMVAIDVERPDDLVDTCGTGGGSINTFNISTAAALLVAGSGVRVAKHGNRSFTTRCGSADVLEELGISIEAPVSVMRAALEDAGIVFMFAPLMHPAMRHVGPIRRELGIPTVMNMVGPLANPARAGRQVVGVADERRVELMAGALRALDTAHALVVHGAGMDEISPFGETRVVEVRAGRVSEWTIDPARYGFAAGDPADIAGGSREDNAATVMRVLRGDANPSATAAVVLNAAAAFYVSGRVGDFGAGVDAARSAIASGVGLVALERLRAAFSARPGN
jgi:anthranilate phosphoribosyltransferase